jgi:cytochrome c biogenesis protein CcdA/thiol-disulfide isomerase/thioredoxin
MQLQFLFAILAGVLTIAAPCILPLLPILLGTSVGRTSKTRPLYIVAGFVLVFAALGVFLSFLTKHLGLSAQGLRYGAIGLLSVFGVLLIWPKPFEVLTMRMNGFINRASETGKMRSDDLGGFILGATLGVVWTPCAGPVLGAILTLIATQSDLLKSSSLLVGYALGAGIPMLVIAYGSQWVTTRVRAVARYAKRLQQVFGVLILLLAVAMFYNYDVILSAKLTEVFPASNIEEKLTQQADQTEQEQAMGKVDFKNYGKAPDFAGISKWLNSDPLTIADLKGRVVLVDFWTFSCVNCIRTLPYVTKWYDIYKDKGFVVVGVHTPEFEFEKDTANVQDAIRRSKINYPVAQDNDFVTWNKYSNQYWPAEYLIDKDGNVVYVHFGEGNYDVTENAVRSLLGLDMEAGDDQGQDLSKVASPEIYFGTDRLEYLSADQTAVSAPQSYVQPNGLPLNRFALGGNWTFGRQSVRLNQPHGTIRLHFKSGKLFMVAQSDRPQTVTLTVDGQAQPPVTVAGSQLYTLYDSMDYNDHVIEISIPDAGFEAYTFTFG